MIKMWPQELPRPERSSWQVSPQDARRKRQSDAGPPGYRRRFSSAAKMVSLSIVVRRNGKGIFDNFFHHECNEGTRLFYMTDPTTEGFPLYASNGLPLLTSDGQPLLLAGRWLCAWGDQMPVETVQGTEFRKTFSVVVMP